MHCKRYKSSAKTTDMPQKPNLIRHLADFSGAVTTYIQLINQNWVYFAIAYDQKVRKLLTWNVG